MESLCPNCQKLITVPEQYAGQTMKCPLCQQTFQAPALPSSAPAPATFTPPPPADFYKLNPEPAAPQSAGATSATAPSSKPQPPAPPPPTPPSPPLPAGHGRKFTIQLSPAVLPWIPAVAFFLIFVLTFFTWVGWYPGGIGVVTQNAWQATFGYRTLDAAFDEMKTDDAKLFDATNDEPGFSVISFFYLLTFIPIMLATFAVVAASAIPIKLPPALQPFWSWRFLAIGALTLIPLLFLLFQCLAGFPVEDKARAKVEKEFKERHKDATTDIRIKQVEIREGMMYGSYGVGRMRAHSLVILLHVLATVCALFAFWIERRGANRPLPRFEFLW
jgi:hypothetical protein